MPPLMAFKPLNSSLMRMELGELTTDEILTKMSRLAVSYNINIIAGSMASASD